MNKQIRRQRSNHIQQINGNRKLSRNNVYGHYILEYIDIEGLQPDHQTIKHVNRNNEIVKTLH